MFVTFAIKNKIDTERATRQHAEWNLNYEIERRKDEKTKQHDANKLLLKCENKEF